MPAHCASRWMMGRDKLGCLGSCSAGMIRIEAYPICAQITCKLWFHRTVFQRRSFILHIYLNNKSCIPHRLSQVVAATAMECHLVSSCKVQHIFLDCPIKIAEPRHQSMAEGWQKYTHLDQLLLSVKSCRLLGDQDGAVLDLTIFVFVAVELVQIGHHLAAGPLLPSTC